MTMIAELGHYALVLALGLALVQASVPIVGARKDDPALMAVAGPTAVVQFCFMAIAFAALTICYVRSDFSVINVFENSHSAKPLDLQDLRRVGQPRRLDAAVGAHPRPVRRSCRVIRQ